MAKGVGGVTPQNEALLFYAPRVKRSKWKPSKTPQSTSRISQLFSRISGKDKKASSLYYMPTKAPFTSTPDMSAEEDGPFGVEISYVETESEDNNSLQDNVPTTEILVDKSTSVTECCISDTVLDDTATTSPDYSTNSASGSNTGEEEKVMESFISHTPPVQQMTEPKTEIVGLNSDNPGKPENSEGRSMLRKARYVAVVILEVSVTIMMLFWSIVIAKVIYGDFYRTKSEASTLCSGLQAIDAWLPLGLAKIINCNDNPDNLLERLFREAKLVFSFLTIQCRRIPVYWHVIAVMLNEFYEKWIQRVIQNTAECLKNYYEIIWTSSSDFIEKCFNLITHFCLISKGFVTEIYGNA